MNCFKVVMISVNISQTESNTLYKLSVCFNFVKSLAHVDKCFKCRSVAFVTYCGFFNITVVMCIVQGWQARLNLLCCSGWYIGVCWHTELFQLLHLPLFSSIQEKCTKLGLADLESEGKKKNPSVIQSVAFCQWFTFSLSP